MNIPLQLLLLNQCPLLRRNQYKFSSHRITSFHNYHKPPPSASWCGGSTLRCGGSPRRRFGGGQNEDDGNAERAQCCEAVKALVAEKNQGRGLGRRGLQRN